MEGNAKLLGLHEGSSVMKNHACKAFIIIVLVGCSGIGRNGEEPAPVIRPQEGAELCDEVAEKLGPPSSDNPDALDCDFAYPVPVQNDGTLQCGQDYCECSEASFTGCITFEAWCIEQHANGVFWNTQCIIDQVTACDQVETLCNVQ